MFCVYIGLGSNVGDRLQYLTKAVHEIRTLGRILSVSSVYETTPVEMQSENQFYNMAVALETELNPQELIEQLKHIEHQLGRQPSTHLQDRAIDLDILLYENMQYKNAGIEIPHPRLTYRRFALESLCEIAPNALHPVSGKTIQELLRESPAQGRVERTIHNIIH